MTPKEILINQINHNDTPRVPYTFGCEDAELSEKLLKYFDTTSFDQILTRYMASAGAVDSNREQPIDEIYAIDAFHTKWRMDKRPWHLETPGLPEPSFDSYQFPDPSDFAVPDLKQNAQKEIDSNPDRFTVLHNGWGIFEQTWRMRGFENALVDAIGDPGFFGELVERLTELRLSMVAQFDGIPADAVMFGDDWGDQRGIILGPDLWRRFIKPAWAKVYDVVHAQGKLVMSHSCGSVAEILPDLIEIGLDVLESVQPEPAGMEPYGLKSKFGADITFWGTIGSQSTIQFGKPSDIKAVVRERAEVMSKGGGFILATAKGLQPGTPFENAVAYIEALMEL